MVCMDKGTCICVPDEGTQLTALEGFEEWIHDHEEQDW